MRSKKTSPQNQVLPQRGFTIVELLVVIVVIAILAAVSILTYNGIQKRAGTIAYTQAAHDVEQYIRINDVTESFRRDPDTLEGTGKALGYVLAFIILTIYGAPAPGGECIGDAIDYPATGDFEAGECYRITVMKADGTITTEGYSVNSELAGRLAEAGMRLPRNLPTVRRTVTIGDQKVKFVSRGIYVILLEKLSYVIWNPPDSTGCGTGQNFGALFADALKEVNVDELVEQIKQDPEAVAAAQEQYGADWETSYREMVAELMDPNRRSGACVSMFTNG